MDGPRAARFEAGAMHAAKAYINAGLVCAFPMCLAGAYRGCRAFLTRGSTLFNIRKLNNETRIYCYVVNSNTRNGISLYCFRNYDF